MTSVVHEAASREATLRTLELLITRRLDGVLHGEYQGLLPGAGSEPGEAREYQLGDDVRHMDWNLTARTTIPHVRDTVADRELETWLVVDRTASMDFGTTRYEKREIALAASAAFAFLTNRAGNRCGAVVIDPGRTGIVPAAAGREAALALLHRLGATPTPAAATLPKAVRVKGTGTAPGPGSGSHSAIAPAARPKTLTDGLVVADRVARKRGLVVVMSDFLDQGDWARSVRRLTQRHQVIAVEVRDPREDTLPAVGLLTLVDPESGARVEVQTNQAKLRARFATAAAERRAATAAAIRSSGARHVLLSTDRDWVLDLLAAVDRWRRIR